MSTFGKRLRLLRKERSMNEEDFARQFHISQSSVNMYELGKREPNLEKITQFAEFFNVSIDYLVGRTDDRSKTFKPMTRNLLDALHLTDEEIAELFPAIVDGQPVSKEDFKRFIIQVRLHRQMEREQLPPSEK